MRKLEIGTDNYTEVFAVDEKEFNANHIYSITAKNPNDGANTVIKFQKGPIKENGVNGCHNEDLISIVIDRLESFQSSDYRCRENAIVITKLEESLMWLRKRTDNRIKRNVEGTSKI
jgi:hypothetical protein